MSFSSPPTDIFYYTIVGLVKKISRNHIKLGHQNLALLSVINLRLENAKPDFVTRRIIDAVSEMEKELEVGAVVSVDETSARYRKLPISLE